MERSTPLQRISRVLHWIGEFTSSSGKTLAVVLVLVIFGIVLGVNRFPQTWQTSFATIVSAITLVMLFVIQHTQSRHQKVLQLKLDELIRASPEADDLAVHLEDAPDDELIEREREQIAHQEAMRDDGELEIIEFNPGKKP